MSERLTDTELQMALELSPEHSTMRRIAKELVARRAADLSADDRCLLQELYDDIEHNDWDDKPPVIALLNRLLGDAP